ncbi:MAG: hypothetical protein DRJ67_01485 [Thermoprotei archaeon]|nr:MAG: hypothetical protein DRJ67_01485 [Thermoprotei archaeon]
MISERFKPLSEPRTRRYVIVDTNMGVSWWAVEQACKSPDSVCYFPSSVLSEMRPVTGRMPFEMPVPRGVEVAEPTDRERGVVRRVCVEEAGLRLSPADVDVVASALRLKQSGFNAVVYSDDDGVNVCAALLGIETLKRPPRHVLARAASRAGRVVR